MADLSRLAPTPSGALFATSDLGLVCPYRYRLWRRWSDGTTAAFIGLNPSTADETQDDPTIRRCVGFAKAWGHGALEMLNLFAFRSTDPSRLPFVADPVGPENDSHLKDVVSRASLVVCAWGNDGNIQCRNEAVRKMLAPLAQLHHLGLTKGGHPKHPLYLKGDLKPVPWEVQRA